MNNKCDTVAFELEYGNYLGSKNVLYTLLTKNLFFNLSWVHVNSRPSVSATVNIKLQYLSHSGLGQDSFRLNQPLLRVICSSLESWTKILYSNTSLHAQVIMQKSM